MSERKKGVSRRDFMRGALAAGAAFGGLTILGASARGQGKVLKAGLVGCGGRGRGAAVNFLEAGKYLKTDVTITAIADLYKDPMEKTRERLKQDGCDIPDARCFAGFDGYKKLVDSGVDFVLLATPPVFRPLHFETAVKAGKHVFMEKPVCVDPVGGQRVIAAGEEAAKKNLCVVAGTQRRHDIGYLAAKKLVDDGVVGSLWGGAVYWCGASSWITRREPGWSDIEYITKNWINFVQMSGDHVIEQHVHNLDVMVWFLGAVPTLAVGVGGRARRKTGNQYDFFSVDYTFAGKDKPIVHVHSLCRQVNGTWSRETEELIGDKGRILAKSVYLHPRKRVELPKIEGHDNAYVQEHVDLINAVVKEKPLNEAEQVANSTLVGIMGRLSAYTGQPVRFTDVCKPDGQFGKLALSPTAEDFEKGEIKLPAEEIPLPGVAEA
ncbi:MAG TPA: Gfo/Idh/MocA family oxidoreductase [Planctomycetota bacterium]|nr:Gfo/Idh/MocA family oxidoreductase [Planctomycetota bacterium]